MTPPLVSVLIPCHNAERWIGETISSVLEQTHSNLEVIVVDDGSTDGSLERLRAFTDPRIRVIGQPNGGAAKARNTALEASRGSLVQWLDADDLLDPQKIACQVVQLLGHPCHVACAAWARFTQTPREADCTIEEVPYRSEPLTWLLRALDSGGGMLFPARWLIPRPIVETAGPWDESLTLNDDGEYFTRIVLASQGVLTCEQAKCYYRSGIEGSLSSSRSPAAWSSYYHSIELITARLLRTGPTESTKMACSKLWQHFAQAVFPYDADLCDEAMGHASQLHPVELAAEGGRAFLAISSVFGWRLAMRLRQIKDRFR